MFSFLPQILVATFFLPEEFSVQVDGIVLLPYRIVLLIAVVPALVRLTAERRFRLYDIAMALLVVPLLASMMYNHGFASGLASGGLAALEITGSYFVARAYLNSDAQLRRFVDCWVLLAAAVLPFLLLEAFSGSYLVHPFIQSVTGFHYSTSEFHSSDIIKGLSRLGLQRAMGPFSHPILCGVVYSTFVPYVLLTYKGPKRVIALAILIAGVLSTVSSTAIVAIVIMAALCGLFVLAATRHWQSPVRSLALVILPIGIAVNTLSNRGLMSVLVTALALNTWNGYYRTLIWTYGMANVWAHPLFGLGYNDWVRPIWMPPSVDCYWLVVGIRHGALAFFLLLGITVIAFLQLISLYGRTALDRPNFRRNAAIWGTTLFGVAVEGLTVAYWGPIAMLLPLVVGVVVNIVDAEQLAGQTKPSPALPMAGMALHRIAGAGASRTSAGAAPRQPKIFSAIKRRSGESAMGSRP